MPTTINGTTGVSLVQDNVITSLNQPSGSVIQVANFFTGEVATGTTIIPLDDTIPQNTEGTQFMSLAFTPKKANSILKIECIVNQAASLADSMHVLALFRDSTANAVGVSIAQGVSSAFNVNIKCTAFVSAGAITPTTFYVRTGGNAAGTITFNGRSGARVYGGALASSITITEIVG